MTNSEKQNYQGMQREAEGNFYLIVAVKGGKIISSVLRWRAVGLTPSRYFLYNA